MTQDEIVEMYLQVSKELCNDTEWCWAGVGEPLQMFAKLVAAKALAQPEQEPEAWMYQEYRDDDQFGWRDEIQFVQPPNDPNYFKNITPVYTHPPQRTWVGLTDEEKHKIWYEMQNIMGWYSFQEIANAIEAKLKEKNT